MNLLRMGCILAISAGCAFADTVTLTSGKLIYGGCIALFPDALIVRDKGIIEMRFVRNVELEPATIQRLFSTEALEEALRIRRLASQLQNSSFKFPAGQTAQPARHPLAGVWRYESSSLSHYQEVILTLRDDGTYTKKLTARMSSWSGAPSSGGEHNGTWRANGRTVQLSGDGNWPAFTHDLGTFQRVR